MERRRKKSLRMDIIGELPLELSQRILELLRPEDLGRCLLVSRSWRRTANSDFIWKKFSARQMEIHSPRPSVRNSGGGEGKLCYWASVYMSSYYRIRTNWQKNRYRTATVERRGEYACSLWCTRDLVAVAYCSGILEIYTLPSLKHVQTLEIRIPGREILSVQMDDRLVAITKANITLIYRRTSERNEFLLEEAVAINKTVTSTRDMDSVEEWMGNLLIRASLWEGRLLVNGALWLRQKGTGCVFVWDCGVSRALATPPLAVIAAHSNAVFASSALSLIRFDSRGHPQQVVETGAEVSSLLAGEGGVVGGLCGGGWVVWGWRGRLPPGGVVAWGPRGTLIHATGAPGALLVSAWTHDSLVPLWTIRHPVATAQVPSLTKLVLILDRFVLCHFVVKRLSEYAVLSARNGTFMYASATSSGFVDHADDRSVVSLRVTMDGSSLHLRRFDVAPAQHDR